MGDTMPQLVICPVCGLQEPDVTKEAFVDGDYSVYDCARCGKYKISRTAETIASSERWVDILPLVSARIRECSEYEDDMPVVDSYAFKNMEGVGENIADDLNIIRLLKYIASKTKSPGEAVLIVDNFDYPIVWGKNAKNLQYYMSYLIDNKLVTHMDKGVFGESFAYKVRLEIPGRNKLNETSTFVSRCERTKWMSVNEHMDAAYANLTINPVSPYYKNSAHSCREALVALANELYDSNIHGCFDPFPSSYSNALEKLDRVTGDLLKGGKRKAERSMAKVAIDVASKFAHAELVSFSQACNCYSCVKAVIEVVSHSVG